MTQLFSLLLLLPVPSCGQIKDHPFALDARGHYTGNAISPSFSLKIENAPAKSWIYTYSDNGYGRVKDPVIVRQGTYELDGSLALFSEKLKRPAADGATEARFGLNFGFPGGVLTFNRFFPNERKEMVYRRKCFQSKKGVVQPTEELLLTLASPLPKEGSKTWEVAWKGKRIAWKEGGKVKTEEPIDLRLVYQQHRGNYYYLEKPHAAFWLPTDLIFHAENGQTESIAVTNGCIGELHGFHPGYGDSVKLP